MLGKKKGKKYHLIKGGAIIKRDIVMVEAGLDKAFEGFMLKEKEKKKNTISSGVEQSSK